MKFERIFVAYLILFVLSFCGYCSTYTGQVSNDDLIFALEFAALVVFCVLIVNFLGCMIYWSTSAGKKKFEDSLERIPFTHISGLKNIAENKPVSIMVIDETITIIDLDGKSREILGFSDIQQIKHISREEFTEKDKSVIARAIVGGLVFGAVGAVVGGLSGVGTKKETEVENFAKVILKNNDEIYLAPLMNSFEPINLLMSRCKKLQLQKI